MACAGMFGSGKTAFASWLAGQLAAARGGVPVWANYGLLGAVPVHTFDDLYECVGGVIVLDELQGTIHARRSSHNLEFLRWFDQCRKQDSDVICITQALHKIDVIVREMIELCFACSRENEHMSIITPYDLARGKTKPAFYFDRRASYGLYNHKERAWALVGAEEADKRGARPGVPGARRSPGGGSLRAVGR
jgi:hypothetical protein